MIPERSAEGLQSEPLFHQAQVVVWTEGGTLPERDQIAEERPGLDWDTYSDAADDIAFWRIIFSRCRPDVSFYFKAAGSKTRARRMAAEVAARKMASVAVCLDRDHDWIADKLIVDANVIYSRGYSWENEVWTPALVRKAFKLAYSGTAHEAEAVAIIEQRARHFESKLRWYVRSDTIREIIGCRYLSKYRKGLVVTDSSNLPSIRTTHIVRNRREELTVNITLSPAQKAVILDTHMGCVGHIVASFYFHTLRHLIIRFANMSSVPSEITTAFMMVVFSISLGEEGSGLTDYCDKISRLRI